MEITMKEELGEEFKKEYPGLNFDSPEAMFDYLWDCGDLYSPSEMEYLFSYNEAGSIAAYGIDPDEAKELAKKSRQFDEYWGAFLGPGGEIFDTAEYEYNDDGIDYAMQLCRDLYRAEWYDTRDYADMVLGKEN